MGEFVDEVAQLVHFDTRVRYAFSRRIKYSKRFLHNFLLYFLFFSSIFNNNAIIIPAIVFFFSDMGAISRRFNYDAPSLLFIKTMSCLTCSTISRMNECGISRTANFYDYFIQLVHDKLYRFAILILCSFVYIPWVVNAR